MKRILVTGGAGFIGSHLVCRLLKEGEEIICLDNFYTGSEANMRSWGQLGHFHLQRQDIAQPFQTDVDEIYNLACPASPIHYQNRPVQTTKACVHGVINMLDLAKQSGAKILQASTSEVYGDPEIHPQTESYWGRVNPIGIRACYDEGKRCAETLFFDYYRQYNVPIKVARIFNTYGPNMHIEDGRVISNFIVQALKNKPITIYGDGSQTRSFCYVDDMVEGLVSLMATDSDVTGPVNLGNPKESTIKEIAELIVQLTESKSKIAYLPLPSDDPKQRQPDIREAKKVLNWEPKTKLKVGLLKAIAYFEEKLGHEKN